MRPDVRQVFAHIARWLLPALAAWCAPAAAQGDARACGAQAQACVLQCRQQPAQMQACLTTCGQTERICRAGAAAQTAASRENADRQPVARPFDRETLMAMAQQFHAGGGDRVQLARRAAQSLDLDLAALPAASADRQQRVRDLMGSYSNFLGADLQVSQARADADPALAITRQMRLKIEAEANRVAQSTPAPTAQAAASACSMPGKSSAELIASLRGVLEQAERELDQMRGRRFLELNDDVFLPALDCLMAAARQQLASIPTSGPNAAARFAKWDAEVGGPAMVLARRWANLPHRRAFGMQTWAQMLDRDGEGLYWRDLVGHAAPKSEDAAEELRRVIDQRTPTAKAVTAGTAVPMLTPEARQPKPAPQPIVVIATPRTLGLAMAAAQFGRGVGGLVAHLENKRREYAQLEQRIRSDRDGYWACLATRCNALESRQVAFIEALMLKDLFLLRSPSARAFDDGLVPGCQREFTAVKEAASQFVAIDPEAQPDAWEKAAREVFAGKSYAVWQACRDRSEYIQRPRPALL
jgi:hypothetical protein